MQVLPAEVLEVAVEQARHGVGVGVATAPGIGQVDVSPPAFAVGRFGDAVLGRPGVRVELEVALVLELPDRPATIAVEGGLEEGLVPGGRAVGAQTDRGAVVEERHGVEGIDGLALRSFVGAGDHPEVLAIAVVDPGVRGDRLDLPPEQELNEVDLVRAQVLDHASQAVRGIECSRFGVVTTTTSALPISAFQSVAARSKPYRIWVSASRCASRPAIPERTSSIPSRPQLLVRFEA